MFISKYNIKFDYNTSGTLMLDEFYSLPNNRAIFCNNYKIKSNTFLLDTMLSYFKTYNPIFSFYVRKVDKNIRKNSRGKSGKYSLVWKYVPLYKRMYTVMRWFIKDIKFQKGKTFRERLYKAFGLFIHNPENTFMGKCRKFNHFFVFLNFKKSLVKTLKSTS